VTGKKLNIEQLPAQPGDVELTNADVSKARKLLGYDPKTSFRDGMRLFHDWFVKHRA
jgi:UDP-glucuronate 4-epimerase